MFSLFLLPSLGHLPVWLSSNQTHDSIVSPCSQISMDPRSKHRTLKKVGERCSRVLISPMQQMGVGSELGRNRFWMGLCIIHADLMGLTRVRQATSPEAELSNSKSLCHEGLAEGDWISRRYGSGKLAERARPSGALLNPENKATLLQGLVMLDTCYIREIFHTKLLEAIVIKNHWCLGERKGARSSI